MLKFKNITVLFNKKPILKNLTAHLHARDFVTIIGPNGAGKSTLFKALAGLAKIESGFISFDNKNMNNLSISERALLVSQLHQNPTRSTVSDLTVRENLALSLYKGKKSSLHNGLGLLKNSFIIQSIKRFFNDSILEKRMDELSGGQRQLLALMMATAIPTPLLLLDEPTAALDKKTAQKMLDFIKGFKSHYNGIVLLITHDLHIARDVGNILWVIDDGRLKHEFKNKDKKQLSLNEMQNLL